MKLPLQIAYRGMDSSPAIEAHVRRAAEELDQFFDRITSCRVVIEAPHRHSHKGKIFHVRVDLTAPGAELVAGRDPAEHHAHEDLHVAIRDAFKAARRQLQDHDRRRTDRTKLHAVPLHGEVLRVFPERGYGFIQAADGQEIYFHRNSVTDGRFDALEPGTQVRFALHEGEGEQGPQASAVTPVGKHHLPPVESV